MNDIKHEGTIFLVCPYCGEDFGDDSWCHEGEGETFCAECDEEFTYQVNDDESFTTQKKEI